MIKNLRIPIFVGALLPLIVAVVAQASYTLISQREAMDDGLDSKARSLAGMLVDVAGPSLAFDDDKAVTDSLGFVASDPDFAFAAVLAADGRAVAVRGALGEGGFRDLAGVGPAARIARRDGLSIVAAPVISDGRRIGSLFVGLRSDRVHAQAAAMAERASLISLLGIIVAIVVVQVLARAIARRNGQMRLVLDHVDEGLATIRRDGSLDAECSAAFATWFGAPRAGHFAAQIAAHDPAVLGQLELAWSDLVEGTLPPELLVMQFPTRLVRDATHFRLDIKPLSTNGAVTGALLRIRDVTAEVDAQAKLAAQREYVAIVERALADPGGVSEFIEDTEGWVAKLSAGSLDQAAGRRALHTIKGNAAVFGVSTVADAAHRIEDELAPDALVDRASAHELIAAWAAFAGRVERLMGGARDHVHVTRTEVEALAKLAEHAGAMAADRLRRLLLESVAVRFDGLRDRIARAADNAGKPHPDVTVDAGDVWLSPDRLRGVWDVFAHLIRNALDHGIEAPADRALAGKPDAGRIELRARTCDGAVILEIADDGRGVAWDRVRDKARAAGVPSETRDDLERALFFDRISTAATVTTTSGRGIGLAAVDAAAREAGGRVTVRSEPGRGTTFVFTFAPKEIQS